MEVRSAAVVLTVDGVQALIDLLRGQGRCVVGPVVRDGAVDLGEITAVRELPGGVRATQAPGRYRLSPRDDGALFAHAAPASSLKRLFFPPREPVLPGDGVPGERPVAVLGVRSCDLHALTWHDRVLTGRAVPDVRYARRRAEAFIVAVTCTEAGGTCFCAALGTGPEPQPGSGYDLRLTELLDGGHRFVAVPGGPRGAEVLAALPFAAASPADLTAAEDAVLTASRAMTRSLDLTGLRDDLYGAAEHPHWEDVGARCLACGACTLVCPTCFCTSLEDTSDFGGANPRRTRVWDSCFTAAFSYLHGGSVRASTAARYRQWVTHKLAAWTDQFGGPGCVGCGRCTTWCPAGIDLLSEVAAVRGARAASRGDPGSDGAEA